MENIPVCVSNMNDIEYAIRNCYVLTPKQLADIALFTSDKKFYIITLYNEVMNIINETF